MPGQIRKTNGKPPLRTGQKCVAKRVPYEYLKGAKPRGGGLSVTDRMVSTLLHPAKKRQECRLKYKAIYPNKIIPKHSFKG